MVQLIKQVWSNNETLVFTLVLFSLQYELKELKRICFQQMFSDITQDNAAEALIVADLYRAGDVKAAAISFIRR